MKRSLCIDGRMARHSGIGTVIRNLVPYLASEFDTSILLPPTLYKTEFQNLNLKRIQVSSDIYSLKEQVEIPLKVPNTDLLWVPHYNIPVWPTRARHLAVTVHDTFHLDFAESLSVVKQLYAKSLMQTIARKASVILTVSNFSKNCLSNHLSVDLSKIQVIYNGIDSEVFELPVSREHLPNSILTPYYLWVGNIKPNKNLILLVKAMEKMEEKKMSLPLIVLAGKMEGLRSHEVEAVERINVNPILKRQFIFLGEVSGSQLLALYQNAEALLFPSRYEGFGLPPLEALAAGILPVVSRIPVMTELYSEKAVFVDPEYPEELVNFFCEGNPKKTFAHLVENGKSLVKKLNWEVTALGYINAFHQIAAS